MKSTPNLDDRANLIPHATYKAQSTDSLLRIQTPLNPKPLNPKLLNP